MEITKDTTEGLTAWLYHDFLTVIKIKTNGDVQQKYQQKYIVARSVVNQTTLQITLIGTVKIPEYMNSEPLDVIYNPSNTILKSYMAVYKKYN